LAESAIPAGTFVDGSFVTESGDQTKAHSVSWVETNKDKETKIFHPATGPQAEQIKREMEKKEGISDVNKYTEELYAVLDGTGNVERGMRIDEAKTLRDDLIKTVQHDEQARKKIELIPMLELYKRLYPKEWQDAVDNGRT
jgi:mannose-6-phosphate isomerase-like protein (cupin superfamily)